MKIEKRQANFNYSLRKGSIKYIVIHDTGNSSKGANAKAHFEYFNSGDKGASANIFVDSKEAIEIIDCKYAAWHCGDGRGAKGITNDNSIGIEICINSDGNYRESLKNTLSVVKILMKKYGIDAEKIVRHYDASGKVCPKTMSENNWDKWRAFKREISGESIVSKEEFVNLHPHNEIWAVYPLDKEPILGNQCGYLAPKRYKGLSYRIEGNPESDVYIIKTSVFGKVQIYVPRDKDSVIGNYKYY